MITDDTNRLIRCLPCLVMANGRTGRASAGFRGRREVREPLVQESVVQFAARLES
jgi:hypothetical protein